MDNLDTGRTPQQTKRKDQSQRLTIPVATNTKALPQELPCSPAEYGGPNGLEPTRYGDWERNGRCVDF
ncbi:MAG: DUF1674 domain-containing protein [Candidatus Eutrophobiaceae bacterium]